MLRFRRAVAIGLVGCLAGCATRPNPRARAPDWQSEESLQAAAQNPAPPRPAAVAVPSVAPAPIAARPEPTIVPRTPKAAQEIWVALTRWCQSNSLPAPVSGPVQPTPAYTLNSSHGALLLRAGTRVAHWNGLELRLGFAPQAINGQPFVHWLDLAKTVEPLLLGPIASWTNNTARIIVIDPGHGGENPGTRSSVGAHYEKDYTLDWGRRLGSLLEAQGWQVYLTRTNDRDMAISDRVAFAQEHKADLFVSLHFNSSSPNDNQAGLETYCLTPTGMPSTVTREFDDDPAEVLPNNAFDADNLRLALSVHNELLQVNGHKDRGVRHARFLGVLRGQQRPAILIEGGYLSNPAEAKLIAEPQYRQKLADAVARGLGGRSGGGN